MSARVSDPIGRARMASHAQAELEAHSNLEDRTENNIVAENADYINSTEDEIAAFSKKIAEIEKIPDATERMKAEKELVDSLSTDAQDIASTDPDYGHIFDEGYFDKLNPNGQQAALSPQPTQPGPGPTG